MSLRMSLIYLRNLRFSKNVLSNNKVDKSNNPSLKSCVQCSININNTKN